MENISNFGSKALEMVKPHYKLISSILIGIFLPWILTSIFMVFLGVSPALRDATGGNLNIMFTMTIFYSFNLTYELPFFGNGFWLCFLIWAVPGLLIGLITRNLKKSLIYSVIGIGVNYFLYLLLVGLFGSALPGAFIDILVSPTLYAEFGLITPINLFLQITFNSFVLPIFILFTLVGHLILPEQLITESPADITLKKTQEYSTQ